MDIDISEVRNIQLRPINLERGDQILASDWCISATQWLFTQDNGIGFLATITEESNISSWDVYNHETELWPEWATHVVWYNK